MKPPGRAGALLLFVLLLFPSTLTAVPAAENAPPGRFVPEGTVVLFDEAHYPVYTVNPANPSGYASGSNPSGAYADFAGVLKNGGFTVKTLDYGYYIDANSLEDVKVLVIVCSQGRSPDGSISVPYTSDEVSNIVKFVRNGGGLFLIGDHTTFPPAIFPVSQQFGISYGEKLLHDPNDHVHNTTSMLPPEDDVFIVLGRDNINNHPLMRNISRVELYRTDLIDALPSEAQSLIISDNDTYYLDDLGKKVSAPRSIVSAAIPSNGTAGAGRIVVVADTNTFETDENRDDDGDMDLFDSDNELYGYQIVEWLADIPEHRAVTLTSGEKDTPGAKVLSHNCSAGSNTTFYIQIENAGNIPDTYDLAIADPGQSNWVCSLSNPAITLKGTEFRIMTLNVMVPAGALVGDAATFEITARSRTDDTVMSSILCRVSVPSVHRLQLLCPLNTRTVRTGETAYYDLVLTNLGNIREKVEILAETQSPLWDAQSDIAAAELEPGATRQFGLSVHGLTGLLGGQTGNVTVRALSPMGGAANVSASTITTILQEFSVRLACAAPVQGVNPGSLTTFPVSVTNLGNGNDELSLSFVGGSRWTSSIEPSHIVLPFNSTEYVTVVTKAPPGSPANETAELTVTANSVFNATARDTIRLKAVVNRVTSFTIEIDPQTQYADPGTGSTFNVTVTNTGNNPETILLGAGGDGLLSAVDVPLGMAEARHLILTVPVPAGAEAWSRINVTVNGISVHDTGIGQNASASVIVNQLHGIRGELDMTEFSLYPGEMALSNLTVWNEGNGPELAYATVDNLQSGWGGGPDEVLLKLDRAGTARTLVRVAVPARAQAGDYNFSLKLSDGVGKTVVLPFVIEVRQIHNFTLSVFPEFQKTPPGKRVTFTLYIRNFGNGPETLVLSPSGKTAGWQTLAEGSVSINISSERSVSLSVRPAPDAAPGRYRLTITGAGGGNITQQASFDVIVLEGSTSSDDLPCYLLAALMVIAAVAAYLVSRRIKRAQKDSELENELRAAELQKARRQPRKKKAQQ